MKVQDCQFIEIKIDNKAIEGASEEPKYNKWIEGRVQGGIDVVSGPQGAYFSPVNISAPMTQDMLSLYEKFITRGYKTIQVTVVHRASDQYNPDYESQRYVYENCKMNALSVEPGEQTLMHMSFTFEGSVEMTYMLPNGKGTDLVKAGPTKFSVANNKLA
ncbi:hypothetical protein [Enterobacter mori]|uniref:hypothetical protein n=1 Tax=Enterobacter mori TaxID=539813 RepID=UPI003B83CA9C